MLCLYDVDMLLNAINVLDPRRTVFTYCVCVMLDALIRDPDVAVTSVAGNFWKDK